MPNSTNTSTTNAVLAHRYIEELIELEQRWAKEYEVTAGNNLNLNLSRGKPAADQLALSDPLDGILEGDYEAQDGTDARNYGGLRGLPEARVLGSEILGVPADEIIMYAD